MCSPIRQIEKQGLSSSYVLEGDTSESDVALENRAYHDALTKLGLRLGLYFALLQTTLIKLACYCAEIILNEFTIEGTMAIKLREDESVKTEVHFHWSAFLLAKLWAGIGAIAAVSTVISLFTETDKSNDRQSPSLVLIAVIFFGPLAYKWLQNKFKKYVVTNQRVYIETGLLSKSKNDIPLNKINDVSLKQNLLQRIFGSGNIVILTGNDIPTIIRDIDQPDQFKDAISDMMVKKSAS